MKETLCAFCALLVTLKNSQNFRHCKYCGDAVCNKCMPVKAKKEEEKKEEEEKGKKRRAPKYACFQCRYNPFYATIKLEIKFEPCTGLMLQRSKFKSIGEELKSNQRDERKSLANNYNRRDNNDYHRHHHHRHHRERKKHSHHRKRSKRRSDSEEFQDEVDDFD